MARHKLASVFSDEDSGCLRCRCGISLLIRLVHTGICLAIAGSLMLKDTELRRCLVDIEDPVYGGTFLIVLFLSLALYFTTAHTNPGYVPITDYRKSLGGHNHTLEMGSSGSEEEEGEHVELDTLESEPFKRKYKYRFCDYCEIQPPLRSKHCEDCKLCVRRYDHHCPWLEACIGERNHKYFWWFLLVTGTLIVWTFVIVWDSFITKQTWTDWFHTNIVLFLDTVVLVLAGPLVLGLLIFHTYLMLNGLSTWEVSSRARISYLRYLDDESNPFDEGCLKNAYVFLCLFKTRRWELLYSKKARFKNKGSGV